MNLMYLKEFRSQSFKTGILVSLGIIVSQTIKVATIYHLFSLDFSLGLVAISFLLVGYFLSLTRGPAKNVAFSELNASQSRLVETSNHFWTLTAREHTILEMLVQGKSNKEMAVALSVEVSTIKTHINNSYAKLQCKNRKEARAKFIGYFATKASSPKL